MATEQRLIDANDLTAQMAANFAQCVYDGVDSEECQFALDTISEAPTIDAEPVVHGRWIRKGNKNECDQCGFFYYSTRADYRRCPKCEAKMDMKEADHG